MHINKYLPFACCYFFFNSLALPFGLTYTALLSPLLYWWVITTRKKEVLLPFFVGLCPFLIVHVINGVDTGSYIISIVNYLLVYIFCQAFYTFLISVKDAEVIFRRILIFNTIACLLAIPVYFSSFKPVLWMVHNISDGLENFSRLKLFTYEASYYAMLFVPLFFFYFMQLVLHQNKINSWLLLGMLMLPLLLSFSIGVIACIFVSLSVVYLLYIKRLSKKKRVLNLLLIFGTSSVALLFLLWFFMPQNALYMRLQNILSGNDTSGNGRTSEAFMLAVKMIRLKSDAWGIGAGQVKILGADIVRSYYLYSLDYNTIAIPNAAAETLAIFGWLGLLIRISIEIFFFMFTKVWTNYFRLLLFLFIFIYQFTGSFITNLAEYVIWILAFTNVFGQFDVRTGKMQTTTH